ncbi:MAG: di-trans,poly-cis-decaprenylcistransferase [Gemmatimonadaceae bacterium]
MKPTTLNTAIAVPGRLPDRRSTTLDSPLPTPERLSVAIIMDGNGRWAAARGMPRVAGHRRGAESVRHVVEAASSLGIGTLTLYAFSSDNWTRPPREVATLMRLFRSYLGSEAPKLAENGVCLSVFGRRDRLSLALRSAIVLAEATTRGGDKLHLRVAIDYSARDAIVEAARRANARGKLTRDRFAELLNEAHAAGAPARDVDLLIRTGGEQRLSDFMLWECAYAELYFTELMWPDFGATALNEAINDFHGRQRRFGSITQKVRRKA